MIMKKLFAKAMMLFLLTACSSPSSFAQSTADSGIYGNETNFTGEGAQGVGGTYSLPTYSQQPLAVPTALARVTPKIGMQGKNGLPPCQMDSFVHNAGGMADLIYGDEGTDGPPPYSSFTAIHRIEAGIFGDTREGLTTGHATNLPSAWGNDEFLGAEWSKPSTGRPR